jgi:hypothetical protein
MSLGELPRLPVEPLWLKGEPTWLQGEPSWLRFEHLQLLLFHFDADPDPAFHFDADPTSHNVADPYVSRSGIPQYSAVNYFMYMAI